jgi:NADH:ubiquinone oxidoreductase subunit 4 (subunit M)
MILTALILVLVVGGLLAWFTERWHSAWPRWLALIALTIDLVLSSVLWAVPASCLQAGDLSHAQSATPACGQPHKAGTMNTTDCIAVLPLLVVAASAVVVMLFAACYRQPRWALVLTLLGLAVACALLPLAATVVPRQITPLLILDGYALFYLGLIFAATFAVAILCYGYFGKRERHHEEVYLLLLAALGAAVLVASSHFAAFFLGLELLSVALFALIAYPVGVRHALEAGIKYLVLAGVSSAFLLFGMALIYAELAWIPMLVF